MRIDVSTMPFSRRCSWLNFACPIKPAHQTLGPGLYLRSSHHRPIVHRELFKLTLHRHGRELPYEIEADPHVLRLRAENALVEIVLDGNTARIRGHAAMCRFEMTVKVVGNDGITAWTVPAYWDGPGRFTVNIRPSLHRYQFERISGEMSAEAPWEGESVSFARIDCGRNNEPWEIAIDEYNSTWTPRKRPPFDAVLRAAEKEFDTFAAAFDTPASRLRDATRRAAYLLWSCTKPANGLLQRESVFMSINWMDQVWSWDNWFNAAALAGPHPQLALDQMLVMADHQDAFGAYPDGLNDGFKHYNFSKPPVQGLLLAWIRRHAESFWTPANLRQIYPTVSRFTQWWLDHRRWPGGGGASLCHYLHGNDSGWDNTSLLREGSPLVSPDLNAFLAVQANTLADIAITLKKPRDVVHWKTVSSELRTALLRELWQPSGNGRTGEFVGRLPHKDNRPVAAECLITCMPLVLGKHLPAPMRTACVKRVRSLLTPHGLATEKPGSPHYIEDGYWRGPTWGPSTMLIVIGLQSCGETALANTIAKRYINTCARIGFPENYGSLTGLPLRDPAYTWTASAFLELARTSP